MGAPDPDGIRVEFYDGRVVVLYQVWREANPKTRKARAKRLLKLIGRDGEGWRCVRCDEPIPIFRRADARYCSTGCRKGAARERRKERGRAGPSGPVAARDG